MMDNYFYNNKRVRNMMFNTIFNNISVISVISVSIIGGENHQPVANHEQFLSHNVVSSTPHPEWKSNSQPYNHEHDGPNKIK